jgi:hypothetical protein
MAAAIVVSPEAPSPTGEPASLGDAESVGVVASVGAASVGEPASPGAVGLELLHATALAAQAKETRTRIECLIMGVGIRFFRRVVNDQRG